MSLAKDSPINAKLQALAHSLRDTRLSDLCKESTRAAAFSRSGAGLTLDYAKQYLTAEVMESLLELVAAAGLSDAISAMLGGERINNTEQRAVLHTALRAPADADIRVDGENVVPAVHAVLDHMARFVDAVHDGSWLGYTGKPIDTIVNIGIGGSDLGPAMMATALKRYRVNGMRAFFVSNVDYTDLGETLLEVDCETTLFVIESKTFTTRETRLNAQSARAWFLQQPATTEADIARHFVAVSTNADGVAAFGIDTDNMFGFWDWVGGRYSVWSAVGLPVALLIGMARFRELLAGAHAMDEHFRDAPFADNLPVLLALIGIWNRNFLACASLAILPYDFRLRLLPSYLQQLEMESTGKHVRKDGTEVEGLTCPVVWGGPGNNGQHAYYQLLHQGTARVPVDIIVARRDTWQQPEHQRVVLANAIGQAEAMMTGRSENAVRDAMRAAGASAEDIERIAPHRVMYGGRPSTMIVYDELTPQILGALTALYEHKVFVQSVVWGVNAFDQWGVELGKQLASVIEAELQQSGAELQHDASTNALIETVRD